MGNLAFFQISLLLLLALCLSSVPSFARRSGGSGGGGRISSSGGSFGRSRSWGGGGRAAGLGGGHRSSSVRWGSSGGGGFGGSARSVSSPTRIGGSSGTYGGGAAATRYGSSGLSGSSGRYGGGLTSNSARYGSSGAAGGAVKSGTSGASATRYGSASSSSGRIGTGTALGAGAAGGAIGASATRFGGGSYSGAGSSAGKVGASPTLTRYGSQQSSTGGVYGSSGGAGASASRWGTSASSGRAGTPIDSMRTRFAGNTGGAVRSPTSAGNARPNYGSSSTSYNRPQVNAPAAARSQPSKVVYSTTYNNYQNSGSRYGTSGGFGGGGSGLLGGGSRSGFGTGSLVATGLAAGVGGYALGRMMSGLGGYGGYGGGMGYGGMGYGGMGYGGMGYGGMGYGGMGGCGMMGCSPYTTYVPYRDRYQEYYPTPAPVDQYNPNNQGQSAVSGGGGQVAPMPEATTVAPKNIDLCMLVRWNRELAFAEMPNMALDFLVNNNVSGNTTSDKAKFMNEFLTVSIDAYEQYNSSADIFAIPPTFDLSTCNIKVSKTSLINNANAVQSEEPILTSIRHMLSIYSNKSTNPDDLRDVVEAARACLPQGPTVTNPEVLSCIDFSLSPEKMLKMDVPHSMFGSSEICRRQLNPDMFKCVPKAQGSPCKIEHLTKLNVFARNFYLCSEAMDDTTSAPAPNQNAGVISWPGTTRSSVIFITTAKPGFWSRIFG